MEEKIHTLEKRFDENKIILDYSLNNISEITFLNQELQ